MFTCSIENMPTKSNLPPEFDSLLAELAEAPDNVRAMWKYALALMMIDDKKARVLGTRVEDGHELIAVRTIAGDEFEIARPAMSEDTETILLEQIREIVADEPEE